MDFVNCTGSEWTLWDGCTHYTHYYGCSHDDDVGVQCEPGIMHILHMHVHIRACGIHFQMYQQILKCWVLNVKENIWRTSKYSILQGD